MEKVTLTKEQVSAIEEIKDKDYAINILALNKRPDHPLASLEMSLIAKLLYGLVEYEVEPEKPKFKIGDKVIFQNKLMTLDIKASTTNAWYGNSDYFMFANEFRHATTEEIYWLETLRRDFVGDFRIGDTVEAEGHKMIKITDAYLLKCAKQWDRDELIIGIYPAESFKPYSR